MSPSMSRLAVVLLLCLLLLGTGCIGTFELTNSVYDWNQRVSDSRWAREGVFLVLVILPVYGLTLLADALIFNSIEFWTGDNMLADSAPPIVAPVPDATPAG